MKNRYTVTKEQNLIILLTLAFHLIGSRYMRINGTCPCDPRGSAPESGWGKKDDEDERAYARRCLQMAHSMYKPKSVKRGFHR